jgi:hypothetical protein
MIVNSFGHYLPQSVHDHEIVWEQTSDLQRRPPSHRPCRTSPGASGLGPGNAFGQVS